MSATCPPNPALAVFEYDIDFTQYQTTPPNWTVSPDENVDFGVFGAEFTFSKPLDAPSISTNFYILFGHVEVVMEAAPGTGIISSATLMSDDQDEIDWEFSGNNFRAGKGIVGSNYFSKGITADYDRGLYHTVDSPQTKFHTYTLDWSINELKWSIDGVAVRILENTGPNASYPYPQSPMQLQLGLWDGGDPSNENGTIQWAGGLTNTSQAPFTMYVSSVKIQTANPCNGGYQYTDNTGNYNSIKCVSTLS